MVHRRVKSFPVRGFLFGSRFEVQQMLRILSLCDCNVSRHYSSRSYAWLKLSTRGRDSFFTFLHQSTNFVSCFVHVDLVWRKRKIFFDLLVVSDRRRKNLLSLITHGALIYRLLKWHFLDFASKAKGNYVDTYDIK